MSVNTDGFTLVQRRKRGKRPDFQRNERKAPHNVEFATSSEGRYGVDKAAVEKKLRTSREELVVSDFYSSFKDSLKCVFDLKPESASDSRPMPFVGKSDANDGAILHETNHHPSTDAKLCPAGGIVDGNPSKEQCEVQLQNTGARTAPCVKDRDGKQIRSQAECADDNDQAWQTEEERTETRLSDDLSDEELIEVKGHGSDAAIGQPVQSVVCYGLGNFSDSVIARYQLALLLLLCEFLKIPLDSCHVYDPIFTPEESEILVSLGMDVIQRNEECKREVSQPTLFYMPHCCKPLYNNLLWANLNLDRLSKVFIIGNSFSHIKERLPSRILEKDFACLHQIMPHTREVPVRNNFRFTDIFNDTAIHLFPSDELQKIPEAFWERRDEPLYDSDLILDS